MRKNHFTLAFGLLTLMLASPWQSVDANASDASLPPPYLRKAKINAEDKKADVSKDHPMMKVLTKTFVKSPFRSVAKGVHRIPVNNKKLSIARADGDGKELWGNVAYQAAWGAEGKAHYGVYSFAAKSPLVFNMLFENTHCVANGGAALIDGIYHSLYFDTSYASWGVYFLNHSAYDVETGEEIISNVDVDDYSMTATETAIDEATGTVYGEFFTSDFNSLQLGIVDYDAMTRTTIGTLSQRYVALGITKEGVLYGISTDGNLYKIDKATATETVVGPTGVSLVNSSGQFYGQTGEIDQSTNTFYWASIDISGNSVLYTVDLNTGTPTKIADSPDQEQVYGMVIPKAAAADGAPAKGEITSFFFKDGATQGNMTVVAPTKTYGGQDLDANTELTYKVYVNGEVNGAGGYMYPGKSGKYGLNNVPEGMNKFTVVFTNSAGDGPKANASYYVGFDTPKPVTGVTLDLNSETGVANLSWTAPTEGLNGGYIGSLTYDVVRYPDGKKVAEGISETTFTETLTKSGLAAYSYGVTAINGSKKSAEAKSDATVFGDAITLPYYQPFNTAADFATFTVVNANNDEYKWEYDEANKYAVYKYNASLAADDWLITPPITFEKDKVYTVSFDVKSGLGSYKERLEVKYGKGNDPANQIETLFEAQEIPGEMTTYTCDLMPTENGNLYLGFHAVSDPNMFKLILDSLSIGEGRPTTVPGAPTELKAVPGAQGAKYADVSLKAPTVDFAGKALSGNLTKIELLRGDSIVNTFENVAAGAALTFKDTYAASATGVYTAVAYNADGIGKKSEKVSVYVGEDVPANPSNIKAVDALTAINLSWDPASEVGVNGGYVNPSNVKYGIYDLVEGMFGTEPKLREVVTTNSYSIEGATNIGDEQDFAQYGVDVQNEAGQSKILVTPAVITGAPYTIPFVESFPGSKLTYEMWWLAGTSTGKLTFTESPSFDNDGGAAKFTSQSASDSLYLRSGKIALAGASKSTLIFSHYCTPGSSISLTTYIQKPDGTADELQTIDYSELAGEAGWTTEKIDLSAYKDLSYVIVSFLFKSTAADQVVLLDAISVRNLVAKDLAAALIAPDKVKKGETASVTVKVSNNGEDAVSGYSVKLTANGKEVGSVEAPEELASMAVREFKFDYKPSIFDEAETAQLKAEVVFSSDMDQANNTAQADVKLEASGLPKPLTITADEEAGGVKVNWTVDENPAQTVTDDFEQYEAWLIENIGEWKTINADGGIGSGFWQDLKYTHQYEPFAYIVFNPENLNPGVTTASPVWKPKSGNQMLLSPYKLTEDGKNFLANDSWLISPALSGKAQTVKFWVNNLNEQNKTNNHVFKIMVSSTTADQASFTQLGSDYTKNDATWSEVSVDLPEGTKYFAIENVSDDNNSFALMIDDVTYEKGAPDVTGFNVYRDGEKLQTVAADARELVDANSPAGDHTYSVTALYAEGESAPVSTTITTAIGEVELTSAKTFTVYTVDGQVVGRDLKSLNLLKPGVYIVNDKKVVVK